MPTDLSKYAHTHSYEELERRRTASEMALLNERMRYESLRRAMDPAYTPHPPDTLSSEKFKEYCDTVLAGMPGTYNIETETYEMPTPVPTFKEKHYVKLAGIIARSMQSVNKEVDPRHHEAVFKAVTIIVNRMVTELAEDNKLFNKGLFVKAITDASKPPS